MQFSLFECQNIAIFSCMPLLLAKRSFSMPKLQCMWSLRVHGCVACYCHWGTVPKNLCKLSLELTFFNQIWLQLVKKCQR